MAIQLKNNAVGYLATAINASDTGAVLQTGDGASFPALLGPDYFYATLESSGGTFEVVKVTARSGDSLTILRAQEGSTANSFAAGSRVEQRITAQTLIDVTIEYQSDAENITYNPPFVGGVATNVELKLAQTVSVKDFGAVGDGVTDDTAAIQAAIDAVGVAGGGNVLFPSSVGNYVVLGTITLVPYVNLTGVSNFRPTINYTGSTTLFNFLGTSEAQALDVTISNLSLICNTLTTSVGVRVRNFSNLYLKSVSMYQFQTATWADWGIGVYIEECNFSVNTNAVNLGGGTGGIRGGVFSSSPYLDTVVIQKSAFSENEIDINDMGSENALGGLSINNCSFANFDAGSSKSRNIHISARRGFEIHSNWFEEFKAATNSIVLNIFDYFGTARTQPFGGKIFANMFRHQGGAGAVGIGVDRCEALSIENNDFWWGNASGGYPIDMRDATSPATIGQNAYSVYSGGAYVAPVQQIVDFNIFVDPTQIQRPLAGPLTGSFVTLPNGMIMQYGSVSFSATATPTWTFPKAFPTQCVSASCQVIHIGTTDYATLNTDIIATTVTSAVSFRLNTNTPTAINGVCFAIGY